MKCIWQEKRKAADKFIFEPTVMGANAQLTPESEEFARHSDVETRVVPVSVENKHRIDPKGAMEYVDENIIGVYVILSNMDVSLPSSGFKFSLTCMLIYYAL